MVKVLRTIEKDGEVYINLNDLINKIEDHKKNVTTGGRGDIIYALAHDHIIELIGIYNDIS